MGETDAQQQQQQQQEGGAAAPPAAKQRVISKEEMAKHNTEDDCWIAVHGKVYDITKFLPDHPGGPEVITNIAGQDTSEEFEEIGHSDSARHQAVPYEIGVLEGHEETATGCVVPKDEKAKKAASSGGGGMSGIIPLILVAIIAILTYFIIARQSTT
ncbi:unnamed protein product [Vitrella brassicaformis CCMP3155]|uniref:Cytochrome b5 heme-binding domain-containing protein n=1 Tax=Vitrella brassicaformis (strain CCMP3155) TaxID=1169540 RepID=A0A0G4F8P9_VITBC|nr:unnamed protein product [Vitrella brassicaformis CCMP3155]|mmetsp:Transcript_38735/g.96938  ORF Transcript_38735/g.96938 Transcript_38735/m.96938 type:complete len:157 (-) Transcript_38735:11-481(-)|eukprot:CEM08558.1 unnamed protein product [Vitrella brassicaformis CCMP3155]